MYINCKIQLMCVNKIPFIVQNRTKCFFLFINNETVKIKIIKKKKLQRKSSSSWTCTMFISFCEDGTDLQLQKEVCDR